MTNLSKRPALRAIAAALLVTSAMCGLSLSSAHAQTSEAETHQFAIRAQPLVDALREYSRITGVQLAYAASIGQNVTSSGVSGDMSAVAALSRLLEGTGLTYQFTGPKAVTLTPAPTAQSGAVQLGAVRVEGATSRSVVRDPGSTENSGSYGSNLTAMGKTFQTVREIPQSLSIVTRQRMDDQNLDTLEAAMQQTVGASVLQIDAGRSNLFFRGFSLDTIQLDGVSVQFASNFATSPDLFAYDRVEVLRGPAGLFQGAGEPAAGLNLARKRALDDLQVIAGASLGSWAYKRIEADITGPLTRTGALRARLLASYEDREFFTDGLNSKRPMVYGTLEYDVSPDTTVSVGGTYQKIDYVPFAGLSAYANGTQANVPSSTFMGADWNSWIAETTDLFVEVDHRLSNGGQIKFSGRNVDRSTDAQYATANGAIGTSGALTGFSRMNVVRLDYAQEDTSFDAFFSTPFTLGGLEQNILIGANYRKWNFDQNTGNGAFFNQSIFNPVRNVPEQTVAITNRFQSDQEQYGFYGQARLKPISWATLIVGGRVSWFDTKTVTLTTGAISGASKANAEVTPYAGIVADLNGTLSAYVSFAEIFQPQSQSDAQGNLLAPRTGRQYEAGLKGSWLDGKLNAHAAVFDIKDQNRAVTDPAAPLFSIAAGKVRSWGFETEITGEIMPNWQINAGYAYTRSEYVIATSALEGLSFRPTTPRHSANLWTRYTIDKGLLDGVSLGAGLKSVSKFHNLSGTTRFEAAGYTIVNVQTGYRFSPHAEVTLSVNNLFDKEYYHWVNTALNGNRFGEPRSFRLTFNTRW